MLGKLLGPKRRVPRPGPAFDQPRVSIEAGISQGWHRFIGENGVAIAIDRFGASAPGGVNMTKFGFTADNVCSKVLGLLGKALIRRCRLNGAVVSENTKAARCHGYRAVFVFGGRQKKLKRLTAISSSGTNNQAVSVINNKCSPCAI